MRLLIGALGVVLDVGAVLAGQEPLDGAGLLGQAQQVDLRVDDAAADGRDDRVGTGGRVGVAYVLGVGDVACDDGEAGGLPL